MRALGEQGEDEMAICEARREASEETNPVDTSVPDF